ncbi:TIR domain-containing protein [Aeromonas dhakensis]|uniref:TIR domain-containing protein n=1 Tax=Aeromonas dhakensis TaxID=196024 RepID=UPI0028DA5CA4|nr:TIR domain-containing protein [Aeromonas dhakensis]
MTRKVFYSFHFVPDVTRVSQVRNIGSLEANKPASDNDWETVKSGKDSAIKKWIADQMKGRTCTVVLVGEETANRKWINHEIVESWNKGMGVVGIYIHGLKNMNGNIANKGANPFDYITYGSEGKKLSSIVKCYNPQGTNSKERYAWISEHLENAVEEAIKIRKEN